MMIGMMRTQKRCKKQPYCSRNLRLTRCLKVITMIESLRILNNFSEKQSKPESNKLLEKFSNLQVEKLTFHHQSPTNL